MKYLKKFQTNADYQAFKGGGDWVTPNVSLILDDKSLQFTMVKKQNTININVNIESSYGVLNTEQNEVLTNYLIGTYGLDFTGVPDQCAIRINGLGIIHLLIRKNTRDETFMILGQLEGGGEISMYSYCLISSPNSAEYYVVIP